MQMSLKWLGRVALPAAVFGVAWAVHLGWVGWVHPPACGEPSAAVGEPCCCEAAPGGLASYTESGSYWQGYSYAVSLGFAAVALRRFRERRLFGAGTAALGGATLSGFLAVAGCFLAGCCGSPMLGVYLSLFGASFLPWTKPLVAGLTTAMIAGSYWWMRWRERACCGPMSQGGCATGSSCGCKPPEGVNGPH